MSTIASLFRRCLDVFKQRPLLANMVSFPALYVCAEFSQQTILIHYGGDDSPKTYNWSLLLRYAVFGTSVSAPFLHFWYRYLDRVLRSNGTKVAVQKALADQAVSSSLILIAFYPG
ncbi:unnamed protein product, partial [Ixodes persulcatus]